MRSCHSCYIYGTWKSKEVGGFKVIAWMEAADDGWEGDTKSSGKAWEWYFLLGS